jgi:hypothetical protein
VFFECWTVSAASMAYGNYGWGHICVISRRRHGGTDGWGFVLDGVARSILYDHGTLDVGSGCMNMKQLKPHRTQMLFHTLDCCNSVSINAD